VTSKSSATPAGSAGRGRGPASADRGGGSVRQVQRRAAALRHSVIGQNVVGLLDDDDDDVDVVAVSTPAVGQGRRSRPAKCTKSASPPGKVTYCIRRFVWCIMCDASNELVTSLVIWDHTVLPATRQR